MCALSTSQYLNMTTFAIGDIQGCHQKMEDLIAQIYATSPAADLIFVGDLVNRGPDSLATLRKIRSFGSRAKVVLGNHDLHLLAVAHGIRKHHRSDTLEEILQASDRDELLEWLRHQPIALMEGNNLIVHAGVLPQWTAQQTIELAHEFETMLQGPRWFDFLQEMYGNTPAKWSDALQGNDRLRCIVNALTRMRYCHPDGTMELAADKGAPGTESTLLPWFDVPGRKTSETTIICGHWSTLGLVMRPNLISIDTGCLWGGKLTAVCLDDRSLLQVDCPQYQKPGSI
jgi:bis(5'-nucleosyl)-tetraphosphatase (symmetrical)